MAILPLQDRTTFMVAEDRSKFDGLPLVQTKATTTKNQRAV